MTKTESLLKWAENRVVHAGLSSGASYAYRDAAKAAEKTGDILHVAEWKKGRGRNVQEISPLAIFSSHAN